MLVPMSLEHKIVPLGPEHDNLLYAALLAGEDISSIGGSRYIYYGDTKYGFGPAALLDVAGTPHVAEPHVTWMPWVSLRNKIVNFTTFLKLVGSDEQQIMIICEKDGSEFYEHFVKRGILRKIGHLIDVPLVEEVHMYQYKRRTE